MNKFNLIENASDSLEHALRHMGPIEEKGWEIGRGLLLTLLMLLSFCLKRSSGKYIQHLFSQILINIHLRLNIL